EMGLKATGARSNTMKLDNNVDMNSVDTAGVEDLMDTIEEVKPYWTKPSPKNQPSNGFVTFSLTMGPEYHISRITDVVVVARYLGATFVLPDIRGNELGNKRLQELSKKSDWKVLAIDFRTDLLEKKSCKTTSGARRKGFYNPDEVLAFLRSVGFSANTTIYLTETWWHKGMNDLKEEFPNTYTKDDIMPAENKGEFLKSSNADLARALDLEICSQSDMFIPAVAGLFYGYVT
ncbi:hypothetical protein ACJX0J_028093, partial [Zea mays]